MVNSLRNSSNWLGLFDRDKLLCDVTSIKSLTNSNHTIKDISLVDNTSGRLTPSTLTHKYLLLNQNEGKAKVLRNKILWFYFVGAFDVSPFSGMAVSIPEIICQIKGKAKRSAVFKLLKCIPELCNVSDRISSEQPGNKRPKTLLQNRSD
jgi:hypothetical protein